MFESREDAALKLCPSLKKYVKNKNTIVVALARGGAVLGKVISGYFKLPLDIVIVKKISLAENSELAIGAVGPGGAVYWNRQLCAELNVGIKEKNKLKKEKEELRRKQEQILSVKHLNFNGKVVILVDDGIATGATAIAAAKYLRNGKAKKIIMAAPVAPKDTLRDINRYFDILIILKKLYSFRAVGQFYRDFPQVENEEVKAMLTAGH